MQSPANIARQKQDFRHMFFDLHPCPPVKRNTQLLPYKPDFRHTDELLRHYMQNAFVHKHLWSNKRDGFSHDNTNLILQALQNNMV